MKGGAGQSEYDIASYTKKNLVAVFWAVQSLYKKPMIYALRGTRVCCVKLFFNEFSLLF